MKAYIISDRDFPQAIVLDKDLAENLVADTDWELTELPVLTEPGDVTRYSTYRVCLAFSGVEIERYEVRHFQFTAEYIPPKQTERARVREDFRSGRETHIEGTSLRSFEWALKAALDKLADYRASNPRAGNNWRETP